MLFNHAFVLYVGAQVKETMMCTVIGSFSSQSSFSETMKGKSSVQHCNSDKCERCNVIFVCLKHCFVCLQLGFVWCTQNIGLCDAQCNVIRHLCNAEATSWKHTCPYFFICHSLFTFMFLLFAVYSSCHSHSLFRCQYLSNLK